MITSFFSKSKPINFIVAALYMVVFYYMALFKDYFELSLGSFLMETGVLLLFVFSMVVLNFIAKRNELTERNAYKTILYAAFACMFLNILGNNDILIANLFVLLALRRIISLKSQRKTTQKIFDATFWVCIASLFYFWAILFLVLVFMGILLHVNQNYKNWLIPFVAFFVILSISTTVHLWVAGRFYIFQDWFQASNFNFSAYQELTILLPVAFLLALGIWSSFFYMGIIRKTGANLQASLVLVLVAALIALVISIFSPTKNSSELLFFLAPLSIMVTNYFQILEDKWFKEMLLLIIVGLPVLILFLL